MHAALQATVVAAAVYLLATVTELGFIHAFRPSELELTWISDVFLAAALGLVTWLWLHLRAARLSLLDAERKELVLDTQLRLAADVQQALLPAIPAVIGRARWAAHLQPAGRIGGDYYDLVTRPDGSVVFLLADISGKGIPAAMLLAYTRAVFRTLAAEGLGPSALMARLSEAVYRDVGGSLYLTAIVGHLDPLSGRLTWTGGGHPPGVHVHDGTWRLLAASGGPPAGLIPMAGYEESVTELAPGDVALFVTDGVTEAIESPGTDASARLAETVLATRPDAADVCEHVRRLAAAGTGPAGVEGWTDDRTVLVVSMAPA